MIRRQDQKPGIRPQPVPNVDRGQGDRRRGVAPQRLQQEGVLVFCTDDPVVQIAGIEIIVAAGDGQDGRAVGDREGAVERFLRQRFAVDQLHEGLGMGAPRDRPQARAGPAGKNHRYQRAAIVRIIHRCLGPQGKPRAKIRAGLARS